MNIIILTLLILAIFCIIYFLYVSGEIANWLEIGRNRKINALRNRGFYNKNP